MQDDQQSQLPPLVPDDSDDAASAQQSQGPATDPYSMAVNDDASAYAQELAMQVEPPTASELTADDADLIEKEWVLRAKDIVAKTSLDPYTQVKELNKIKAEYIKKRYNKDIKLSSD